MNKIEKCRTCDSKELTEVFKVENSSYTGIFPLKGETVPVSDMTLVLCGEEDCGLVQISEVFDPTFMYGDNYGYRSGLNASMLDHLSSHANNAKTHSQMGGVVLDIGSNDGSFLKFFDKTWIKIGIDPTAKKFSKYYSSDIIYASEFFTSDVYESLCDEKADIVTSFSMFYDLENPIKFSIDIKHCLKEGGVWIFEQSYLGSMIETNSVDTICHEHVSYYSLKAVEKILGLAGLKVLDISTNNVNGGSFCVTAGHKSRPSLSQNSNENVERFRLAETHRKLQSHKTYVDFRNKINNEINELISICKKYSDGGRKIYGIGASTKGNTYLQIISSKMNIIEAIGEVNPDKFGKVTPGTLIPIVSEDEVLSDQTGVFIVLPWHFKEFFCKNPKFKGKTLIFAMPQVEVVIP